MSGKIFFENIPKDCLVLNARNNGLADMTEGMGQYNEPIGEAVKDNRGVSVFVSTQTFPTIKDDTSYPETIRQYLDTAFGDKDHCYPCKLRGKGCRNTIQHLQDGKIYIRPFAVGNTPTVKKEN